MIPFYPKLGAASDAPAYRMSESDDRCESCAHYRNLGPQGYCEKFSFMAEPAYVCDDYRPADTVKESSLSLGKIYGVAHKVEDSLEDKLHHAAGAADDLTHLDVEGAVSELGGSGLLGRRSGNVLKALEFKRYLMGGKKPKPPEQK